MSRPNRPKCGNWPDQTDLSLGIHQDKQTKIWALAGANSPNIALTLECLFLYIGEWCVMELSVLEFCTHVRMCGCCVCVSVYVCVVCE